MRGGDRGGGVERCGGGDCCGDGGGCRRWSLEGAMVN